MIKHTDNVIIAALRQWMLANQDDTGSHEAADQLGALGAVPVLLEMLDGPLTARCALEVAAALGNYADANHLAHLARHRAEFHQVAAMLDVAIETIVESQEDCTCSQCRDSYDNRSDMGGSFGPNMPPSNQPPFSRN